jgi:DNA-binding transcriptional LysR family regulator
LNYRHSFKLSQRIPMNLKDHLEKLPYFFEVAKCGSIREASEKLFITQPSITKSIKILEESIDKKLFKRMPRGMTLTKEGEILQCYCYQLFSHLGDIEKTLEAPDDPMAGSINVGTYDSIAIYFWPSFLRPFLTKYPKTDLQLATQRSHVIQSMVEKGELDLGLIIEPKETNQSNVEILAQDHFCFYQAVKVKPIYKTLKDAPLIYMPDALGGIDQVHIDQFIHNEGQTRKCYRTSSLESVKELSLNGIGIGLLPRLVAAAEVKKKMLKEVKPQEFKGQKLALHNIGLVYSKHREDSFVVKELIKALKSQKW